mmetsp:Transcript_24138/g.37218  ORF Transcript_24138/g.37218 Transcript_24138/m.37218 type:complete len:288 (-) Transcript_24138:123-986(-)|eukprot:CAMPEP_0196820406 /NCGR_PEP_ID=MMETSP1362-20130617/75110_1 /TAXON_ID=163516 /ORGANISM="Leptocylindrus danicus, Strain CCMP1856" /LENGTH=287 /DNA_ID=CAMNT_0042199273 /DNA_START=202 /DNA_END=1065 /DNA_ORIENTATION=-
MHDLAGKSSLYLYQNRVSGRESATPFSLYQLCMILCPPNPNPNDFKTNGDAMEDLCEKDLFPDILGNELGESSSFSSGSCLSHDSSSSNARNLKRSRVPARRKVAYRRFDGDCWGRSIEGDEHLQCIFSLPSCCVGNLINADTLVMRYDASTGRKSEDGWAKIRNTPILREAAADWYFEVKHGWGEVAGPFSCRHLAHLVASGKLEISTRVWSEELSASAINMRHRNAISDREFNNLCRWRSICDLPYLKIALALFEGDISHESSYSFTSDILPSPTSVYDAAFFDK